MSRPDVEGDAHPRAELYLHAYGESSEAAAVDAHLAQCATCRAELAAIAATRDACDALPSADVSDERWAAMIAAASRRRNSERPRRWRAYVRRAALPAMAAAVVVAAVLGARALGARRDEIDRLTRELQHQRARTALALLREPRSADRLRGVASGSSLLAADSGVSSAFVHALRHDPSPNVRLAVLDALDAAPRRLRLEAELLAALGEERLPAVRLAIIDLVVRLGDARARAALERVAAADADAAVRDRARAGAAELAVGSGRGGDARQ